MLVEERFRDNPYWRRFYDSPSTWVEEKNFTFLVQHTASIKERLAAACLVCDFAVFQDLAYARLVQADGHLDVMQRLYGHLYPPLGRPAMVVYLTCPPEVALARIQARGRPEESVITLEYLAALNQSIEASFKDAPEAPVHVIAMDTCDIVHSATTAERVKNEVLDILHEQVRDR